MGINTLRLEDLSAASEVCIASFMASVAPTLTEEGIASFLSIASEQNIWKRMTEGNTVLAYVSKGKLLGIVELRDEHHIASLFVSPDHQGKGIGRALLEAIQQYVKGNRITVSASLTSVGAYEAFGFVRVGIPDEKSGLKFQPMEKKLNS
ncbi:GNAT family N-acetyltransferase [Parasalinivibrio latis]|uniref:GNAT family N-acetyltransferase n=1 Tax=Parasalinivibrio latis TaxID=2952610 RepID=UPI0030DDF133